MQHLEAGKGPIPPIATVEDCDTALVSFTTGSSGLPKGANRTHGFLTAQHKALAAELPFSPEESDMPAFPIFLLHNIACGLTTVIPAVNFSQPSATDAHRVLRQLLHSKIDTASMSPALLESLAKLTLQAGLELPVRRLFTGGAPVGPDLIRLVQRAAPRAEILVFYGSTEAEPIAHIEGNQMIDWVDNEPGFSEMEGVCVGILSDQVDMVLVPMNKSPISLSETEKVRDLAVDSGRVGEVVVAGDHVCVGYYKNDSAFTENKIQEGQRVWHRTGDLGRTDPQGRLWLVGRLHNAIHRDQDIVFPVRPEQILRQVEGIQTGAYVGMPDATLGEAAWIAYSTQKDQKVDLNSLKRLFEESGIPVDRLVEVDRIPMDPRHNSKVDYKALREALLTK
jgi:acyl-CoA synthetase (AMP-forming)/AMP-acid ligase II